MRLLRTAVVASVSLGILAARASAQTITAPSQDGSILLIEDLVVGDSEAAGAPLFRRIGDVAVDADGRMYILDVFEMTVHLVDREGKAIGRIGEPGAGPGELSSPHHMLMAGDSLLVFQQGGKVSVFGRSGEYRRQYGLTVTAPDFVRQALAVDGSRLLARTSNDVPTSADEPRRPDQLVRLSLTSDEARVFREMPGRDIVLSLGQGGSIDALASAPIPRRTVCSRARDQIYCGWTGEKKLIAFGLKGQVVDSFEVDLPDIRVTAADRAPWLDRYANTGFLRGLKFPDFYPHFDALVGDDEGRLWLLVEASSEAGRTTFWIVDPNAREARAATVDGYVKPRAVKNGMFYGRRVDANRVETLVRYRIES